MPIFLANSAYDLVTHPITLVSLGSAVGGNLRYYLGRWIDQQGWPWGFPWGTLVINVSGSFLLGFLAIIFLERLLPPRRELYLLLGTGFCGGYTTFSTFEWETYKLIREQNYLAAGGNIFLSVLLGLIGVIAGVLLALSIFGRR